MRLTISVGCATGRRSIHDQVRGDVRAKRASVLGRSQRSPVPQVQRQVCKRVVGRADLHALQKFERMAERCAGQILSVSR
jgi:hypothetical protein